MYTYMLYRYAKIMRGLSYEQIEYDINNHFEFVITVLEIEKYENERMEKDQKRATNKAKLKSKFNR